MRILYLGTPDFAVLPLKKLVESKTYDIIGVVTNKDKPVGRKQILTPPPVKVLANQFGLPVYQYDKISVEGLNDLKKLTKGFIQMWDKEIENGAFD